LRSPDADLTIIVEFLHASVREDNYYYTHNCDAVVDSIRSLWFAPLHRRVVRRSRASIACVILAWIFRSHSRERFCLVSDSRYSHVLLGKDAWSLIV